MKILPQFFLNKHTRYLFFKRVFDILFSSMVLIVGAPLYFLIALIIRISSRGPAIYKHERIGKGGKPFYCYKFRTMYSDADARLLEILERDASKKMEWDASQKLKEDPRVTQFGNWLRKTSLDEIPQFWNVLKGDLSVVGPRPVVERELQKFFGGKSPLIRPGLTGLWQVSGRNNVSYHERILLDELYMKSQSLTLDLKLIAKTIPVMFNSKGAY